MTEMHDNNTLWYASNSQFKVCTTINKINFVVFGTDMNRCYTMSVEILIM